MIIHDDEIFTISNEVRKETKRADRKHGSGLKLPSTDIDYSKNRSDYLLEYYEIPSVKRAQFLCDNAQSKGICTWAHIAVEELSEVIECGNNEEAARAELIQLVSVCMRWIRAIDKRQK